MLHRRPQFAVVSAAGSPFARSTTSIVPTGQAICRLGHQNAGSAPGLFGLSFTSPTTPAIVVQSLSLGWSAKKLIRRPTGS